MADSADSSSGSTNDPVTSAITTIREAAKWLVAAFGAVGGALIASLQFKDLGSLSGHERVLAIVGIGIGVLGVAVAIVGASIVLTAGRISLDDVSDKESDAGAYLAPRARRAQWVSQHRRRARPLSQGVARPR